MLRLDDNVDQGFDADATRACLFLDGSKEVHSEGYGIVTVVCTAQSPT